MPWLEVFKGFRKEPRSVTHSQFAKMLPLNIREYITVKDYELRIERINNFVNYLSVYKIESIEKAIEKLGQEAKASDVTVLLHKINGHSTIYRNELDNNDILLDSIHQSDMNVYDRLGMYQNERSTDIRNMQAA